MIESLRCLAPMESTERMLASMAGVFPRREEYLCATELFGLSQFHPGGENYWEATAASAFDLLRANLPPLRPTVCGALLSDYLQLMLG